MHTVLFIFSLNFFFLISLLEMTTITCRKSVVIWTLASVGENRLGDLHTVLVSFRFHAGMHSYFGQTTAHKHQSITDLFLGNLGRNSQTFCMHYNREQFQMNVLVRGSSWWRHGHPNFDQQGQGRVVGKNCRHGEALMMIMMMMLWRFLCFCRKLKSLNACCFC